MVAGWRHLWRVLNLGGGTLRAPGLDHVHQDSWILFSVAGWLHPSGMQISAVGCKTLITKTWSQCDTREWEHVLSLGKHLNALRSFSHDSSHRGIDPNDGQVHGVTEKQMVVDECHKILSQFKNLLYEDRASMSKWVACASYAVKNVHHLDAEGIVAVLRLCFEGRYVNMALYSALLSRIHCPNAELQVHNPQFISGLLRILGLITNHLKRTHQITSPDAGMFLNDCAKVVKHLVAEALSRDIFVTEACKVNFFVDTIYGLGLLNHSHIHKGDLNSRQLMGILLGELHKQNSLSLLGPSQLSQIFYACGAMTYKHFGVFRELCMNLETNLNKFSTSSHGALKNVDEQAMACPQHIVTEPLVTQAAVLVLWGMGVLHFKMESTLGLILKCIGQNILHLTGEHIVMCCEGLYKLDHWPIDHVQAMASRLSIGSVLNELLDEELDSVLRIFSQFAFKNTAVLNAIWLEIGRSNRLPQLKNSVLLSVMESFWKLGFTKPAVWEALGNEIRVASRASAISNRSIALIVLAFGKAGFNHFSLMRYVSEEFCSKGQLENFEDIDMVNVCYGLALLGCKDRVFIGNLAIEVSKPIRLHNFTEDHLSSLIYSFGRLGYRSKILFDELAWEVCKSDRLQALSEHNLSNILWGFAKIRYYNEGIVDAIVIEAASKDRLDRYTDQGLSNVVYSIGRLNYRNKEVLTLLAVEASKRERQKTFTSQAICNIAFAFGKLDFPFIPFMRALERELSKPGRLDQFKELEISNLMYALGKMHFKFPGATENVQMEACKEGRLRRFTGPELANLAFGFGGMCYYVRPALEAFLDEVLKPERIQEFSDSELHSITVKLDDMQVVSSSVLDDLAKEHTARYDESVDWDYPIFRPWKGEWFFHPPFPAEEDVTEEELDGLLRKFAKFQQEQEAQDDTRRPRWSSIEV